MSECWVVDSYFVIWYRNIMATITIGIHQTARLENIDVYRTVLREGQLKNVKINLGEVSNRPSDAGWWYTQAADFYDAFSTLKNAYEKEEVNSYLLPATFVWETAAELYMKTYLLYKGLPSVKVIAFGHGLENLRVACSKMDPYFNHKGLVATVFMIEQFRGKGGTRYPQERGAAPFDGSTMADALAALENFIGPMVTMAGPAGTDLKRGTVYMSPRPAR